MANFGTYQGHLVLSEGFKNMAQGINKAIDKKHDKEMLELKQKGGTGSAANRAFNLQQDQEKEYKTLLQTAYAGFNPSEMFTGDPSNPFNQQALDKINSELNVDFIDNYLKENPDSKLSFDQIEQAQKLTHNRVHQYIGNWQAGQTGEGLQFEDQDEFLEFAKKHPKFQGIVNQLQYRSGIIGDSSLPTSETESLLDPDDRSATVKLDVKDNRSKYDSNSVYHGYSKPKMEKWKKEFKARNDKLNAEHRGFWTDDIDNFTITTDADDKWYIEDDDSAFWNADRHTIKFGRSGPYVTVDGVNYPLNTISHEQIRKIF